MLHVDVRHDQTRAAPDPPHLGYALELRRDARKDQLEQFSRHRHAIPPHYIGIHDVSGNHRDCARDRASQVRDYGMGLVPACSLSDVACAHPANSRERRRNIVHAEFIKRALGSGLWIMARMETHPASFAPRALDPLGACVALPPMMPTSALAFFTSLYIMS